MILKPSPKAVSEVVRRTAFRGVDDAMYNAVDGAVWGAVFLAVAVAVNRAVYGAESFALREGSPHPNLDQFLYWIRQTQGSAP